MRHDAVLCALPLEDWNWNQHQLPICSWIDQYKKLWVYVLEKWHKLIQRVCDAFASLGNVTAKAVSRLLRLLSACTFLKRYVISWTSEKFDKTLVYFDSLHRFLIKALALFPRAGVWVIRWLWFKERGVSSPHSGLLFFWEREQIPCACSSISILLLCV